MEAPFRLPTGELIFRRPATPVFAGGEFLQFGLAFVGLLSTLWMWAG